MLDALPPAKAMLGDRGYDGDWFRDALTARGIAPCIPSKVNRKTPIPHDPVLYPSAQDREHVRQALGLGAASTPATIAALTPACPLSPSPRPSSSGLINEF